MSCAGCCRVIFSVLAILLALAGTIMVIYGGVQYTNVSLSSAQSDNVSSLLDHFISCVDIKNAVPDLNDGTDSEYDKVLLYQCESAHAPMFVAPVLTGIFTFFAVIAGVFLVHCTSSIKTSSHVFNIFAAVTIGLAFLSIIFVASYTNHTVTKFIPCNDLDNKTISRIQNELQVVCVSGTPSGDNKTALKWLADIIVVYAGAAVCILSMLLLLVSYNCVSKPSQQDELSQPLYPTQAAFQYS